MMLKISSYNINGIRAAQRKGFADWVSKSNPDIICLQEVRASDDQIPDEIHSLGYHKEFHCAQKKGYSGVGVFSKQPPKKTIKGIGVDWIDEEGRVITAEFENLRVVSAYFPSGTVGNIRQTMKMKFLDSFIEWGKQFVGDDLPTIICGDFNICHEEIDIHNPHQQHKTSGFLPEERAWVTQFLEKGFVDVFRKQHPGKPDLYSWWSYRAASKQRNKGWRIDYQMATPDMAEKAKEAVIEKEWDISDHAPVSMVYDV